MSDDQRSSICLYVTMTFLLTGLTGIGMAVYMSYYDYDYNNKLDITPINLEYYISRNINDFSK